MTAEALDEAARLLGRLRTADACVGIEQGDGRARTIPIQAIAAATLHGGRVALILTDGSEVGARPSETLVSLEARLQDFPQVIRSHNGWLVNLDQVDTITRTGKGEYALALAGGLVVPLIQNLKAVMAYFQLQSLDNVVPWNERLAIIIREKLRDFPGDLRQMPTEDVRRHFSDGTGALVITQLIGNIVWQAHSWITGGKEPPIDGNIRSFWYSHIKPVLGRVLPEINEGHYGAMIGIFSKYVGDYGLFSYADFGFVDDDDSRRTIGERYPHVIVFAEKKGHRMLLDKIQKQTGTTVITLGGQPSLMTTEFFVADLVRANVPLDQPFHLISEVDYDPSGQIIAESFRDQLRQMGIKQTTMRHLIMPVNFTPAEIQFSKYPVKNESPSDRTKVKQWLNPDKRRFPEREPGGLPDEAGVRQPMGLESDAMPKQRIIDKAAEAVQLVTASPADRNVSPAPIVGFPYPLY